MCRNYRYLPEREETYERSKITQEAVDLLLWERAGYSLVFNMFIYPLLMKTQVKEVDYGTFMKMINEKILVK